MSKPVNDPSGLIIIGENIHTTRIVLRHGKRTETTPEGEEAVFFDPSPGERRYLRVPESFKKTQPYEQGQIKHFMIAVQKGISGDPGEEEEGTAYIEFEVRRQETAGAHFLDLNVDEVSYDIKVQKRAMTWLVQTVQEMTACLSASILPMRRSSPRDWLPTPADRTALWSIPSPWSGWRPWTWSRKTMPA